VIVPVATCGQRRAGSANKIRAIQIAYVDRPL
jgi:hypothetical protein